MKIEWNGFLKKAVEEYPKESCCMLFSSKPYAKDEYWVVYPIKNVDPHPEEGWMPDKKEIERLNKVWNER